MSSEEGADQAEADALEAKGAARLERKRARIRSKFSSFFGDDGSGEGEMGEAESADGSGEAEEMEITFTPGSVHCLRANSGWTASSSRTKQKRQFDSGSSASDGRKQRPGGSSMAMEPPTTTTTQRAGRVRASTATMKVHCFESAEGTFSLVSPQFVQGVSTFLPPVSGDGSDGNLAQRWLCAHTRR